MIRRSHLILFLVLFVTSCALMPVNIVQETSYDVSKHKTYNLIPNKQDDLDDLPMDKSRIEIIVTKIMDSQLALKGYRKTSYNPELLVSYYLVTDAKTDFYVVNDYYSHLGYQPPRRSSTRDSFHIQDITYEKGILVVDIIDAQTKQRVWQGYLTTRMDIYKKEEAKEKRLQNGITKIMSYVPY